MIKIACLGPSGTFSEASLKKLPLLDPYSLIFSPCLSGLLKHLHDKTVHYAWLPWWNTGCGFTGDELGHEFFTEIATSTENHRILATAKMPLKFALLTVPGARFEDIKTLYVNPYTKLLCKHFFKENTHIKTIIKASSSAAVKEAAALDETSVGAIGSIAAAKKYHLDVLLDMLLAPNEKAEMEFALVGLNDAPKLCLKTNGQPLKTTICSETDEHATFVRSSAATTNLYLCDYSKTEASPNALLKSLGIRQNY